jgi:polysaccharide export outer membrane protein
MNVGKCLTEFVETRLIATVLCALLLSVGGGAAARADAPSTYRLHGGDQLNVNVYGEQSLSGPAVVLPDGTIGLPLVGRVRVGGQTPEQAAQTISYALQKYVRHPVVTVSVTLEGPINVLVLGNVKTPGKYALQPSANMLTDAIAAAGGLGPVDGPYPDARIAAANGSSLTAVPLQQLLHDGDTTKNVFLQDGQIVYVPSPVTFNVYVAGAVDHPGEIPLNEGDGLAIAIVKAGNSPAVQSDLNNVTVTRTTPDGQKKQYNINLYTVYQNGGAGKDLVMQKGDIVFVPSINPNKRPTGIIGQTFFYIGAGLRALFPKGL